MYVLQLADVLSYTLWLSLLTYVEPSRNAGLHSCLYQLWSAVLASRNTLLQHRLPVTSSYQLAQRPPPPGPTDSDQQPSSKFNPFINSPPLTANVDTNRLADWTAMFPRNPMQAYDMIRCDTSSYFNVRSTADISHLNLPHGTKN